MNFVTSISLVVTGAMFLALLGWGSIRAAWRNCEGRRGVFAALAILAAICSIVAQKPSPDTPTITVDALLRDVGCYATNNVFHAAVTNAPSYAGVDFSDCDLMVYARERASSDAASWFELTPRKKFSQQPADYAIENATNYNYMVYLNYVPPSPVHTNGVFELYGFVIENEAQGEPDQLAAGFINSRAVPLPFDAEVEYLESTGTQYINTGILPNGGTDFELCMFTRRDVNQNAFGSRNAASGLPAWGLIAHGTGNWSINQLGSTWNQQFPRDVGAVHTYAFRNGVALYDGEPKGENSGNVQVNYPATLFAYNSRGAIRPEAVQCVLYCKIWQDGVLVRDFIPVRVGTTGAMYDKRGVGGMNGDGSPRNDGMYFNRGTGNFGYGNDK